MSGTCEKHGDFPGFRCVECELRLDAPVCPNCRNSDEIVYNMGGRKHCLSCGWSWDPSPDEEPHLGACLDEAKATICGERQDQYGNPEDSFELIGSYWATYLQEKAKDGTTIISAKDVAHMMILFKVARCQGQKPKRDNYVDICGYAAIAADRLMEEK
jgi:hypothetical protein